MSRRNHRKPSSPELQRVAPGQMPAELRLRDYIARQQLKAMKKASLGTHAAADRGRQDRDWNPNTGSADLGIITDSMVLLARARQMVRDTWIGKSIVKAYARNVAGRGIQVMPQAVDQQKKPFTELNRQIQEEWAAWSEDKNACDVERKQTFGQKQRMSVKERATVGEHFIVWSYSPPLDVDGNIDLGQPCGLRLQSFEPEQLDLRINAYEGREVRGGVEVDENGAAVAYHFYTRNPNDYLIRRAFWSIRVPRERVFHYFEQERVLQTRGVTPLAPVLQDMRDYARFREAMLWRAIMEACIGVIIKKTIPTMDGSPVTFPMAAGDNGQTRSGMRTMDMVPGMAAELLPGEDVTTLSPTAPGNMYDPYTQNTIRGVGAGVGISYGQIARQSDGNYSSARQDMLEDRKEWEPEHDLIIGDQVRPIYEKFLHFCAMEGRFDDVPGFDFDHFQRYPRLYRAALYIPPAMTWIDPEKEANAFATLLKNRLITREEIVAMRGGRFYETVQQLAAERDAVDQAGLSLPEDDADRTELRKIVEALIAQQLTSGITTNTIDLQDVAKRAGLPVQSKSDQPALPAQPVKDSAAKTTLRQLTAAGAPNYRTADAPDTVSCITCTFRLQNGQCSLFDIMTAPGDVCDAWKALPIGKEDAERSKVFPPGPIPGTAPIDRNFSPAVQNP